MRPVPSALLAAFLLAVPASAGPADRGPTDLLGPAFAGWELVTADRAALASVCRALPDGAVAIDGQPVGYLQTTSSWENFRLHLEWRWSGAPGNGGVLVHIASGPAGGRPWPRCFQIQTKHARAGDLLPMAGATFAESLSTAPGAKTPQRDRTAADSERPAGEWNACDIVARDGALEIAINGVVQNRATACTPAAGRIGFQLEGAPFELRHVRIEPLSSR